MQDILNKTNNRYNYNNNNNIQNSDEEIVGVEDLTPEELEYLKKLKIVK
jgi:predicted DNA binding protein